MFYFEKKNVIRNSIHLLTLINDILDYSKIEAGKIEFDLVPCKISECMKEVASVFHAQANEKRIDFHVITEGDRLPDTPWPDHG